MKGFLTLYADDDHVEVKGHLSEANLLDRVAFVDALMNAFDMKGHTRDLICKLLLSSDKAHQEMDPDKFKDIFETLLKAVMEGHKNEG